MARLGRAIADLARYRRMIEAAAAATHGSTPEAGPARLREVTGFGDDPGNLRMLAYVPPRVAPKPAMVVVLHGCTQTAEGYDRGTGWSTLADRHGFVLLYPEQRRANNPKTCFTWFEPGDTRRGSGEAASIRQMIAAMVEAHDVDERRIFVTGLSAGGAMSSVMLAAYPEVFAGGAIIAGLPYGAASNVSEAFESMFKGSRRTAPQWGALVRAASDHEGPWPRVSVWHGGADTTVVPGNADETVKQWADLHGIALSRAERSLEGQAQRRVWRDADGAVAIESVTIPGLAHGTPLATGLGDEAVGEAGPFLLEAGISSTHHIARFFGLADATVSAETTARPSVAPAEPRRSEVARVEPARADAKRAEPKRAESKRPEPARPQASGPRPIDVQAVINDALRAAGLMRR